MGVRSGLKQQSGFSLVEAVLTTAILAIVAGGTIAAFAGIAKVSAPDPGRDAAEREMRRIFTLAQAATKYADPQSVSINTAPWSTTMPSAAGTPVPLEVSAVKQSLPNSQYAIAVTIVYPRNGSTATLTKNIALVQKAPPPNARIAAPGTHDDPSATPTP